jgi:hypothetical protein
MHAEGALKLPYRAAAQLPATLQARIGARGAPPIPLIERKPG